MRKPTQKIDMSPELSDALQAATTADEREIVTVLLQRYGARSTSDLLPEQIEPFTGELKAILSGRAPHPNDPLPPK